jgi:hypothetical protein
MRDLSSVEVESIAPGRLYGKSSDSLEGHIPSSLKVKEKYRPSSRKKENQVA